MTQFSIRDLLWLALAAGLFLGWMVDRWSLDNRLALTEAACGRAQAAALGWQTLFTRLQIQCAGFREEYDHADE